MKLFNLPILMILCCAVSAQNTPVKLWSSTEYAKSINIKGPTIALDKFQNTYMVTNQTDVNPFGGYSLVKYDTVGNTLWNKNYPPGIIGHFYGSFTVDSMGYSYVSLCFDGGLPGYDADAIMLKYSPDGDKLWETNYGFNQSGDSYVYHSCLDTTHGNLIAFGMNLSDTNPIDNFLFVQAIDTADGSIIWKNTVPGRFRPQNMRIQSNGIDLLSTKYELDGKYYVISQLDFAGNLITQHEKPYSGDEIDFNFISKTGDVIFGNRSFGHNVTRVNSLGDTLWAYQFLSPLNTEQNFVKDIIEDDSSYVYTTGAIETIGNYTEMVTTKFSADGNLVWQEIYHTGNGNLADLGDCLSMNSNLLCIAGKTQLENGDVVCLIRALDKKVGVEKYNIFIDDNNATWSSDLILKEKNIYHNAIGFENNINNLTSLTTCINLPYISVLVSESFKNFSVRLFPNPAIDDVFISNLNKDLFEYVYIHDLKGNILLTKKVMSEQESVSFSNFPSGTYILTLGGKTVSLSKKIIKS